MKNQYERSIWRKFFYEENFSMKKIFLWRINMKNQYEKNFAMKGILLWEEFCYEKNFAMKEILL